MSDLARLKKVCDSFGQYVWICVHAMSPAKPSAMAFPLPAAGYPFSTSITEWEYLAAKEKAERPILPFILAAPELTSTKMNSLYEQGCLLPLSSHE